MFVERFLRDMQSAGLFLTRLPLPQFAEDAEPPSLAQSMRAFPVIGALVGLIGGIVFFIADRLELPPLLAALLALGAQALATGSLHEDGLADTADGFGGGRDPLHRMDIMRDSRIGSFGVVALILAFGIKAAALAALATSGAVGALIAAGAISRGAVPAIIAASHPARQDGLGATAGLPDGSTGTAAILISALIALIFLGSRCLPALALSALAGAAMILLAQRKIGGYTGDVLGASIVVIETAVLVAALP
jgi:adenosylcobinamide-GDP ribazoletransferase